MTVWLYITLKMQLDKSVRRRYTSPDLKSYKL